MRVGWLCELINWTSKAFVLQDGVGVTIVDKTIDVSFYSKNFELIAAPQCTVTFTFWSHPFILVIAINRRQHPCEALLGQYVSLPSIYSYINPVFLADSPFAGDVEHIVRCFDKITKLRFRDAEERLYIKFESIRVNEGHYTRRLYPMVLFFLRWVTWYTSDNYLLLLVLTSTEAYTIFPPVSLPTSSAFQGAHVYMDRPPTQRAGCMKLFTALLTHIFFYVDTKEISQSYFWSNPQQTDPAHWQKACGAVRIVVEIVNLEKSFRLSVYLTTWRKAG